MRLRSPIVRIRFADMEFMSGDGILMNDVQVVLGEEARSSGCQFSLLDPDLKIGGKLQAISFATQGILVPPELLQEPQQAASTPTSSTPATSSDTGSTTAGNLSANMKAMLDTIAWAEGANYNTLFGGGTFDDFSRHPDRVIRRSGFSSTAAGRYQALTSTWEEYSFSDFSPASQDAFAVRRIQYRRATAAIEAGDIPRALTGSGGTSGLAYEWASLPPYRYSGQGTKNMQQVVDFWRARVAFYQGQGGNAPTPPLTPATATPNAPASIAPSAAPVESSFKGTEIIVEIGFEPDKLIAHHFIHTSTKSNWGEQGHFCTIGGKSVRWLLTRQPQTRSFENMSFREVSSALAGGLGIRVDMEGDGTLFRHLDMSGVTPFSLLSREARSIGYRISDDADRLVLEPVARVEFTNLILDERLLISAEFNDQARAADSAPTAAPASTPQQGAQASTTTIDRASGQATQSAPVDTRGISGQAVPGVGSTPVTGTPQQTPSSATRSPLTSTPAVPDATPAAPAPIDTPLAEGEKREYPPETRVEQTQSNGITTDRTIRTQRTIERGKITTVTTTVTIETPPGASSILTRTETKVETQQGTVTTIKLERATGEPTTTTRRSTAVNPEVAKTLATAPASQAAATPESDRFGLPKQPAGAIDLADGRAEPIALVDESQRIKGFASTATLLMEEETLTIVPGQIVGFSSRLFPEPFDREWRVSEVKKDVGAGTVSIGVYTPQAKPPASSGVTSGTSASSAPVATNPGGWIIPTRGRTGDGLGQRSSGRQHKGVDIAAPQGTPIVASADGTVCESAFNGGGWGWYVTLQHAGGLFSRYGHMPSRSPLSIGTQVAQGQQIGVVGSSGRSTGPHLHWEIRRGTSMGEALAPSQVGVTMPPPLRTPQFRY